MKELSVDPSSSKDGTKMVETDNGELKVKVQAPLLSWMMLEEGSIDILGGATVGGHSVAISRGNLPLPVPHQGQCEVSDASECTTNAPNPQAASPITKSVVSLDSGLVMGFSELPRAVHATRIADEKIRGDIKVDDVSPESSESFTCGRSAGDLPVHSDEQYDNYQGDESSNITSSPSSSVDSNNVISPLSISIDSDESSKVGQEEEEVSNGACFSSRSMDSDDSSKSGRNDDYSIAALHSQTTSNYSSFEFRSSSIAQRVRPIAADVLLPATSPRCTMSGDNWVSSLSDESAPESQEKVDSMMQASGWTSLSDKKEESMVWDVVAPAPFEESVSAHMAAIDRQRESEEEAWDTISAVSSSSTKPTNAMSALEQPLRSRNLEGGSGEAQVYPEEDPREWKDRICKRLSALKKQK